jgi:hypothetical protein
MMTGWMNRVGWIVAVAALTAVAAPAQASAAVQQTDVECRCVDDDGDPVDDCTCFRLPNLEMAFAPFGSGPRLGISVDTDQRGTYDAQGARVTRVLDDGPAGEAGLEAGDVIVSIDGQSLLQPLDADREEDFDLDESLPVQRLLALARELEEGQQVRIEYLRDGERMSATIEAQELSGRSFAWAFDADQMRMDAERMREDAERLREQMRDMRVFQWAPEDRDGAGVRFFGGDAPLLIGPLGSARYGVELIELNEGLGSYFGTAEGVLVTEVDDDSTLGLRPGDVILGVGDREATTPNRVLRLMGTYDDNEDITFRIRRNGAETTVTGRLDG